MRVPHFIDLNIKSTYDPPAEVIPKFLNETSRRIRSEDYQWDDKVFDTLSMLCLRKISQNFAELPEIDSLTCEDRNYLLELLPTDLDLDLVVPLIEGDHYWQRRYHDNFRTLNDKKYVGWTWKSLYLEHHIQKVLEEAQPQYKDEESFLPLLELCCPFVRRLTITQLQHWKPPKTSLPEEHPETHPTTHISFVPIFERLQNLSELEICFGMNNIEVNYDPHMFKVSIQDCDHLGSAILYLQHLKVLRVHKSWIECDHIRVLTKKLIFNTSLTELDFSHCRIGDRGAKCIAMLLNVHENIRIVKLRNNRIGEDGVLGLAWALIHPEGTFLDHLDLSLNPLGHGGTMALLRALVRGPHPVEVSLGACGIQGITAVRVGGMLAINSSLEKLDVSSNDIGAEGGMAILEALKKNNTLYELNMEYSNIPEEIKSEIKKCLKKNAALRPRDPNEYTYFQLAFMRNIARVYGNRIMSSLSDDPETD